MSSEHLKTRLLVQLTIPIPNLLKTSYNIEVKGNDFSIKLSFLKVVFLCFSPMLPNEMGKGNLSERFQCLSI